MMWDSIIDFVIHKIFIALMVVAIIGAIVLAVIVVPFILLCIGICMLGEFIAWATWPIQEWLNNREIAYYKRKEDAERNKDSRL